MAWALQFDGVDDYADLAADLDLTGDFDITFVLDCSVSRSDGFLENASSTNNFFGKLNNNVVYCRMGGQTLTYNSGITVGGEATYRWVRSGTTLSAYLNGTLRASNSSFTGGSTLGRIGRFQGDNNISGKLILLECVDSNGVHTRLDPTASNHTTGQPVLTDTIGTNDATGVNFPTDGSAWIDLGGATSIDATATLGTITYNSQSPTVTLTGSVDATATLGAINYQSQSANVSLTGDIDVSATIGTINYQSHSAQIQLAGIIDTTTTLGSINYSSHNPTVSVTGDIDVSPTLGTINYQSHNTQVTVTGDVDITTTLGTINYQSQVAQVILQGTIQAQATLGQISYQSRKATVYFEEAQSIDSFTVSYKQDDVSMSYKNDNFSVTYKN